MTTADRTAQKDTFGAFCPNNGQFELKKDIQGPLSHLRVGVKDLFDVAGHPTGAGNPDWLASHPVPEHNASVIDRILNAGATLVGKTITDELAYSLNGENYHYGTPVNPVSPERIPGGSSAGSAVATAANLCDIGLGTDTAGSIRLPAMFCGIWGFRPTHGVIASDGVVPLAPSYDTIGWTTRNAEVMKTAGSVLLPPDRAGFGIPRLVLANDAWALANPDILSVLNTHVPNLLGSAPVWTRQTLTEEGLLHWQQVFRTIQGYEVWDTHGEWITRQSPQFGPGIAERFKWASTISAKDALQASHERQKITATLDTLLEDTILCIPTVSFIAPLKGSPTAEDDRTRALCLLSIASLAGLPQITLPAGTINGCAVGISFISARHTDQALIAYAANLTDPLNLLRSHTLYNAH